MSVHKKGLKKPADSDSETNVETRFLYFGNNFFRELRRQVLILC
jgi:hypothetical protein